MNSSQSTYAEAQADTAWAYLVVSSELQAQTLPDQKAWADKVALERGWTITRTFQSVSTGADGVRVLFKSLMDALRNTPRAKRPARILMIRLDRLGRGDGLDAMATLAEIRKCGVTIHTRQDGDVTLARASDALSPMFKLITGAFENEARSDKALAVFARKRAAGLVAGNRAPYGLDIISGRHTFLKSHSKAIRTAFKMRANDIGYHTIARYMTENAPSQKFKKGNEKTIHWTSNRVLRLLENEAYLKSGLIDEMTWRRVQNVTKTRSRSQAASKYPWPMSGSIVCECGKALHGHANPQRRTRYYKCTAIWNHDGRTILHPAGAVEGAFEKLLSRLVATPSLIQKHVRNAVAESTFERKRLEKDAVSLRARLAGVDKKIDAVFDLHSLGKVHSDDVAPRLQRLNAEKDEYGDQLRAIEARLEVFEEATTRVADIAAVVANANRLWQRAGRAGDVAGQQTLCRAISRRLGGFVVGVADHRFTVGAPPLRDRQRKASARGA